MKVSIVTVCRNAVSTLPTTIASVAAQSYADIEHIIIDGQSTDGTSELIKGLTKSANLTWVSEEDSGIYDAMNKGIAMSTGDVIGILNADDVFFDRQTVTNIVAAFQASAKLDLVYGDVVFEKAGKVWRTYSARKWNARKLAWGFMPPHPSVFVRRDIYERIGPYKMNYEIAADYEFLVRFFLCNNYTSRYLPITTTRMSLGGVSTKNLKSNIVLNKEIRRACVENGVYTNFFMIYSKYLYKWKELRDV